MSGNDKLTALRRKAMALPQQPGVYIMKDAADNILYIGSAIPANGLPRNRGGDVATVGNMLKCIADKKRLEILRRLSAQPSYGLELAEIMGVDSGHMSRILSQMHGYGFLREDKDRLRVYYRTDPEAIHNFLELVEDTILSK